MNDKLMRLMELLEEIGEIYPELEKVIVNDPENPDYIVMATQPYLEEAAAMFGISEEFAEIEFEEEYPDMTKKDKGTLH